MHININSYIHAHIYIPSMDIYTYPFTFIHVHIYTCTYIHIHSRFLYMYIYTYPLTFFPSFPPNTATAPFSLKMVAQGQKAVNSSMKATELLSQAAALSAEVCLDRKPNLNPKPQILYLTNTT